MKVSRKKHTNRALTNHVILALSCFETGAQTVTDSMIDPGQGINGQLNSVVAFAGNFKNAA